MPDSSIEISHAISRDEVRQQLPHLRPPLRMIAEDWLAESTTIDFITLDPAGHVALLLIGQAGDDAALLTRALAHRSWVAARLGNWRQLAPDLGIASDAQVRAVLLCPSFAPETLAAAEGLEGAIQPVLWSSIESNGGRQSVDHDDRTDSQRDPDADSSGGQASVRFRYHTGSRKERDRTPSRREWRPGHAEHREIPLPGPAPKGPLATPAPGAAPRGRPSRTEAMPFRSGLTEEDLGLTAEEVHEFS